MVSVQTLIKLFAFWVIMHSVLFLLNYPTTMTSTNLSVKPSECQRVLTATCVGYELDIALKLFTTQQNQTFSIRAHLPAACLVLNNYFLLVRAVYIGAQHRRICKDYRPNLTLNVLKIVNTLVGS